MKVIGITGPSGSGKSTLSDAFRQLGLCVFDADEIYHSLLVPPSDCLSEIAEYFGAEVFDNDGTLLRSKLAAVVFGDKAKLEHLNCITHKYVIEKMQLLIDERKSRGDKAVAIDVPLLFESNANGLCKTDVNIAVIADISNRLARIVKRDKISEQEAMKRILAQKDDEFYTSRADKVFYNNADESEAFAFATEFLNKILN